VRFFKHVCSDICPPNSLSLSLSQFKRYIPPPHVVTESNDLLSMNLRSHERNIKMLVLSLDVPKCEGRDAWPSCIELSQILIQDLRFSW
jgi:hypothetical protein